MKRSSESWWLSLPVVGLMMMPAVAQAGTKCINSVVVNTVDRRASGTLGAARNSANGIESLNCAVYAWGYVFCSARNSANVSGSCGTSDPNFFRVVQAVEPSSYIYFTWDAAGTCTELIVSSGSCYEPKQP